MKKTWKPTVAGILDIISGVSFLGAAIWVVSTSGGSGSPEGVILALFWMPFIIVALAGGVCAFRRRMWRLAYYGSISAALVGFVIMMPYVSFLLGIPAIIFIKKSKEEFGRPAQIA